MTTFAAWPQYYETQAAVTIEDFSDIGQFTETGTAGKESAIVQSTDPTGIAFAFDAGDASNRYITRTGVNFSLARDQVLGLTCYIPRVDQAQGLGLTAYLGNDSSFTTNRWSSAIGTIIVPGWNNLLIEANEPAMTGQPRFSTLDGSPSFANAIQSYRFRIDGSATFPRRFVLTKMWRARRERAKVLFTFDDGWSTSYTNGHAYSVTKGIPLTHYIIASLLGTASYITSGQLSTMQAAGDDVQLHGLNRWDLDRSRIASDIAALRDIGYGPAHAAYPEGEYGYRDYSHDAVFESLQEVGVVTARTVMPGQNCTQGGSYQPKALFGINLNNALSLSAARAWVDRAIRVGTTVIFYGHKIDSAADSLTWVTSDWQSLIDYVYEKKQQGLCDTPTISQWYDGLTQPQL